MEAAPPDSCEDHLAFGPSRIADGSNFGHGSPTLRLRRPQCLGQLALGQTPSPTAGTRSAFQELDDCEQQGGILRTIGPQAFDYRRPDQPSRTATNRQDRVWGHQRSTVSQFGFPMTPKFTRESERRRDDLHLTHVPRLSVPLLDC